MLPDVIFNFVVFLLDIRWEFGYEIHFAPKNDIVPHNLFDDPPFYSFIYTLLLNISEFLVFGGAGSSGKGEAFYIFIF